MSDNFKINGFAFNDPQRVRLCYSVNQFRKSDTFADSFSTQIEHGGVKKYWNLSGMVVDSISQLGVEAGDTIIVTRREGKKGSFTEVSLPGDILNAPQNNSKLPRTNESPQDDRIPMEAYMNDTRASKEVKFSDEKPDWDKINWAKCKTLFLQEAFAKGMELNQDTMILCERWADAAMKSDRTIDTRLSF